MTYFKRDEKLKKIQQLKLLKVETVPLNNN